MPLSVSSALPQRPMETSNNGFQGVSISKTVGGAEDILTTDPPACKALATTFLYVALMHQTRH